MKNYVLTAIEKGRVELKEVLVRDPGPKEIQVRVHTSLVSPGTERAFILALDNTDMVFPKELGYSAAGIVEKTGNAVTRFKVGDRVACFCLNHCSLGNVTEDFCMPVENGISFEQAAFLALGVICLQGIRKARIEVGESVMVLGLGPIGQLALQFAKANGALPVIGVDRVESRMKMAFEMGADMVLNAEEKNWEEKLKISTGNVGPKVVIESTGFSDPINAAFRAVSKFGRIALLGCTREETTVNFYSTIHRKALTVVGAHIMGNPEIESRPGFWTWKEDANAFMQMLKFGRIRVEPLITERVEWQDAEDIYKKLLQWNTEMVIPVIHWN